MGAQISINKEAVDQVLKTFLNALDDLQTSRKNILRQFDGAEAMGWTDSTYARIKDDYLASDRLLKDAINNIEEITIPQLRKLQRDIDDL